MDVTSSSQNQVFFTNLLLLGFDPVGMEKKHKISFKRDMFQLPNMRAFQVVSHFLFTKLDPQTSKDVFRTCWPAFDKKQEQEFRKACYNWLTKINREDSEANFLRFGPSLFLSPGGDRFCDLYLAFSRYVLWKVLKTNSTDKDLKCYPHISEKDKILLGVSVKFFKVSTQVVMQQFVKNQETAISLHRAWNAYAQQLVTKNRELKRRIQELEEKIQKEWKTVSETSDIEVDDSIGPENRLLKLSESRMKQLQKVKEYWNKLEEFKSSEDNQWEILNSVRAGKGGITYRLDGSFMPVHIPKQLVDSAGRDLQKRNVLSVYKDGQLDVESFIHVWNACLRMYIEQLHKGKLPDLSSVVSILNETSTTYSALWRQMKTFSDKFKQEIMPHVHQSCKQLHQRLTENMKEDSSPFRVQGTSLQLLPGTPTPSFSPSGNSLNSPLGPKPLHLTPPSGLTPEQVNKRKIVRGKSPLLYDPLSTPQPRFRDVATEHYSLEVPTIVLKQIGQKQQTRIKHTTSNPSTVCSGESSPTISPLRGFLPGDSKTTDVSSTNDKNDNISKPPSTNRKYLPSSKPLRKSTISRKLDKQTLKPSVSAARVLYAPSPKSLVSKSNPRSTKKAIPTKRDRIEAAKDNFSERIIGTGRKAFESKEKLYRTPNSEQAGLENLIYVDKTPTAMSEDKRVNDTSHKTGDILSPAEAIQNSLHDLLRVFDSNMAIRRKSKSPFKKSIGEDTSQLDQDLCIKETSGSSSEPRQEPVSLTLTSHSLLSLPDTLDVEDLLSSMTLPSVPYLDSLDNRDVDRLEDPEFDISLL
ncbi:uncharacterized protein LOC106468735 [Limulus polyphemus]|uniref:Uncharacterized protein LOC106468735 n=1 Tax=Limulus polyphemus TaxID=6850 RepID=A0ABM1TAA6_LIMPO|nr:uncharacterized protein LOC106468735 [Limulus polyphemus]